MTGTRLHLLLVASLAIPFTTQCSETNADPTLPSASNRGGAGGARAGGAGGRSEGSGGATSATGGRTGGGGSSGSGAGGSGGGGAGGTGDAALVDASDASDFDANVDPDAGAPDAIEEPVCGNTVTAVGDMGLVDDFEDGDASSQANDGRAGDWWLALSPTTMATGVPMGGGPLTPVTGGQQGRGMRVRGMESSPMGWGANLVVPVAGIADCYDATVYGGLEFWIRGKAGSKVSVAIQSAQVRALSRDLVGFWRGIVTVTGSWKKETIRFADLMIDYGAPPPFDVTKVTGLGFEPILDPMDATTRSFDFTIDNVAFVK